MQRYDGHQLIYYADYVFYYFKTMFTYTFKLRFLIRRYWKTCMRIERLYNLKYSNFIL